MSRQSIQVFLFGLPLLLTVISCKSQPATTSATASAPVTNRQTYHVIGVVKELQADGKTVVIKHEAVTNYMPAMTMPFEVKNTNELNGLQAGDPVKFEMVVAGEDAWIEQVRKLTPAGTNHPVRLDFRPVRDVDPLAVGDALPEYHFTNELGRAVSTKQFEGQAFAFTFFFTRCPYPTFCPYLSSSFEAAQKKLLANNSAPTNWHLISISFDTEYDSPGELKSYASRYSYNPEHWNFVTGDLTEITAIGDQVGEYFGHDESGGINHNLRTVVVDTRGHIQKIFTDNKWSADDLVAEIIKAAEMKR